MARDDIHRALELTHDGRYLVRVRAVNAAGNTVDVAGYVTEIRMDASIRVSEGDPERGQVHDFGARSILAVERVHGA
jgi:hypothetical protein